MISRLPSKLIVPTSMQPAINSLFFSPQISELFHFLENIALGWSLNYYIKRELWGLFRIIQGIEAIIYRTYIS